MSISEKNADGNPRNASKLLFLRVFLTSVLHLLHIFVQPINSQTHIRERILVVKLLPFMSHFNIRQHGTLSKRIMQTRASIIAVVKAKGQIILICNNKTDSSHSISLSVFEWLQKYDLYVSNVLQRLLFLIIGFFSPLYLFIALLCFIY